MARDYSETIYSVRDGSAGWCVCVRACVCFCFCTVRVFGRLGADKSVMAMSLFLQMAVSALLLLVFPVWPWRFWLTDVPSSCKVSRRDTRRDVMGAFVPRNLLNR